MNQSFFSHRLCSKLKNLELEFAIKNLEIFSHFNDQMLNPNELNMQMNLESLTEMTSYFKFNINNTIILYDLLLKSADFEPLIPNSGTVKGGRIEVSQIEQLMEKNIKAASLNSLYKKLSNYFNSYIIGQLNEVFKMKEIVFEKSVKIVNQEGTIFKNLLKLSFSEVISKKFKYQLNQIIRDDKMQNLGWFNKPIKFYFKDYLASPNYEHDLNLLKEQTGTDSKKLLQKDLKSLVKSLNFLID